MKPRTSPETVTLTVQPSTTCQAGTPGSDTVTIEDDD